MIAGSDSTSEILRCTLYNLLSHPASLHALRSELLSQSLTLPFPKWTEVRELPYLDACINEAVRLHPPFCLPFERVVPEGGIEICDQWFKGGTVVGINPYVANRHKGTFGEDAETWRPDRWLGLGDEGHRRMEQRVLTVSSGDVGTRVIADGFTSSALVGASVWERTLRCWS